jgi:hypothetical protein
MRNAHLASTCFSMVFARQPGRLAKTNYGTRVFTTGTDVRIGPSTATPPPHASSPPDKPVTRHGFPKSN